MPRKNYKKSNQKTPAINRLSASYATGTSTCQSKRRYPTEKQAMFDAETSMLQKPDIELGVYRCEFCQGWHLTRVEK